jgi:hypothetical protein
VGQVVLLPHTLPAVMKCQLIFVEVLNPVRVEIRPDSADIDVNAFRKCHSRSLILEYALDVPSDREISELYHWEE